jgi:O-antigen/teichoic acid export membrane protein
MSGGARKAFRANSAWMMAQAVVQRVVGALSTFAMAHALGPALLGAYSITATTAGSAYAMVRFGLDMGTHVLAAGESPEQSPKRLGEILGLSYCVFFGVALAGAGLCVLAAATFAGRLFANPLAPTFVGLAGVLLFGQVLCQCAYVGFAGLHRFGAYVRVMIIGAPVVALATVAAAVMRGAVAAAWVTGLGQVALAVALAVALRATAGRLGIPIRLRFNKRTLFDVLRIGFPFYVAGLFLVPIDYLAQGGVVRTHGLSSLGDLRVIVAVTSIVTFMPGALNGPMISAFARAHTGTGDVREAFSQNLRVIWTIGLAMSLGIALFWPLFFERLFGAAYHQARSIGYLALITASAMCLRNVLANMLLASGRQRRLLLVNGLEAAVFAATALVMISKYGLAGYLTAQLAGAIAPLLLVWIWAIATRYEDDFVRRTSGAAGLSVIGFAVVAWVNTTPHLDILEWSAAAFSVLLIAAVWPWVALRPAERSAILDLMPWMTRWRRAGPTPP